MDYKLDLAPCGYLELTKDGTIVDINRTFLQMTGYQHDELVSSHFETVLSYANKIMVHTFLFPSLQVNRFVEEMHIILKSKSNLEIPVIFNGSLIEKDGQEVIECIVVKMSKRLNYEQELKSIENKLQEAYQAKNSALQNEQRLKELLETTLLSVNEGLIITDNHGKISLMNGLAEDYTGYTLEEARGQEFSSIFNSNSIITRAKMPDAVMKLMAFGNCDGLLENIILVSKTGLERYVLGGANLLMGNSDPFGVVVTFRDITETKKAEIVLSEVNHKLEVMINDLDYQKTSSDLLLQMSDMLQVCTNMEEGHHVIEGFAPKIFPGSTGVIFSLTDNSRTLEAMNVWGTELASELVFAADQCWALRRNQIYSVDLSRSGLRCQHMSKGFNGFYLDIPMIASSEMIGMVHLEWQNEKKTDRISQEFAKVFADNVSLSLSNIKLRVMLREQSIIDPLTHAFNRRYMEETLDRELPRALRKQTSIGFIMLDVDHFKKFNDTYGHAAGDLVLTHLASLLRSLIRGEDMVCRMGGEEFLMILPEANRDVTMQRAEDIRRAVCSLDLEINNISLGNVSVSLGVALYPEHGSVREEILHQADMALYQAKSKGRNRVEEVPNTSN